MDCATKQCDTLMFDKDSRAIFNGLWGSLYHSSERDTTVIGCRCIDSSFIRRFQLLCLETVFGGAFWEVDTIGRKGNVLL